MSEPIRLPDMRMEVIAALQSLSSRQHQQTRWGHVEDGVSYYDDLTMNVHTLYDDCMVLPEPARAVPDVLHREEVPVFQRLERALGPMIDDLGDRADAEYLSDARWMGVVDAAAAALAKMQTQDDKGALHD